jgi:uncharacterized protein (TIGR00290 family)
MIPGPESVLFCWSGGKDSAMALDAVGRCPDVRVTSLLATITEGYDRISMHGVRRELLERQADSIGLPLREVFIPPDCVNPVYEARMGEAMQAEYARGIRKVVFGDIFLEDIRAYRERNLARIGMTGLFPLWKQDTRQLARHLVAAGFRAVTVCVDSRVLEPGFAGRELDESFFRDLPPGVDPCGENGEFHTFVFDGPIFRAPVSFTRGEVVERGSFHFCDLIPCGNEPAK